MDTNVACSPKTASRPSRSVSCAQVSASLRALSRWSSLRIRVRTSTAQRGAITNSAPSGSAQRSCSEAEALNTTTVGIERAALERISVKAPRAPRPPSAGTRMRSTFGRLPSRIDGNSRRLETQRSCHAFSASRMTRSSAQSSGAAPLRINRCIFQPVLSPRDGVARVSCDLAPEQEAQTPRQVLPFPDRGVSHIHHHRRYRLGRAFEDGTLANLCRQEGSERISVAYGLGGACSSSLH